MFTNHKYDKYTGEEQVFINDELWLHGDYLSDLLIASLEKKKIRKTGELIDSIDFTVVKLIGGFTLQFSFLTYGRAIEIAWHKRSRNTKQLVSKAVWGVNQNRIQRNKDTRWYTRNVYGSLNRLISILMYEFDEATRARAKRIFDREIIKTQI